MEKLAKRLANNIGEMLHFSEEKIAVISYGLTAMFQMAIIFTITSAIGIIGGFWYECMVLFLGVGILRKSVGGAHSETFIGCLVISIFTISFLAFLSRFLSHFIFFINANNLVVMAVEIAVYLFCFILIYLRAPVASKNKPIVNQKKIQRLRRNAFLTFSIYVVISLCLSYFYLKNVRHLSVSISFVFATLWQTFVLTEIGHSFIGIIDRKLTVKE